VFHDVRGSPKADLLLKVALLLYRLHTGNVSHPMPAGNTTWLQMPGNQIVLEPKATVASEAQMQPATEAASVVIVIVTETGPLAVKNFNLKMLLVQWH
jgi:hypothetical protein